MIYRPIMALLEYIRTCISDDMSETYDNVSVGDNSEISINVDEFDDVEHGESDYSDD